MLKSSEIDDISWAERSEYWRNFEPAKRGRRKKYRFREPLILCGHGANVQVNHQTLLVRNGRTHYPQQQEKFRFFPGDPNLPDRIIILDASGGISFDALSWMSEQKVSLVQLDWRGRVNFSGNSGFSANPNLVRVQSQIQGSKAAIEINRQIIAAKFDTCAETLRSIFGNSEIANEAISKIQAWKITFLNSRKANSHGGILGFEGMVASIYYRTWHDLPLKWAELWKRPIPMSWAKVGTRSMTWQREAYNARHPINAMLNYGYAILISMVHAELVSRGFDPSIGIAHRREGNRIPLVYDLIEPLRPIVDRKVLKFSLAHTFKPADFTINRNGGCRLNPQMAGAIVRFTSGIECNDYLEGLTAKIKACSRSVL